MRYTRYDYKKKKNELMTGIIVIGVITALVLVGSLAANAFFKNQHKPGEKTSPGTVETKNTNENQGTGKVEKLMLIQGGVYKVKENAESTKKLLSSFGSPFIAEQEDGSMRVFLGIYPEQEALNISKELTDKGIKNVKVSYEFDKADLCNAEIYEIIAANLKILSKVNEKEVKSVGTEDLKNWCSAQLPAVNKDSKNYSILNELKACINNLPKDMTKDKVAENYAALYNIIRKISTN